MSFDIYGRRPKSQTGARFRNNIGWWHPLADYVLAHVTIPERDYVEWNLNEGYAISAKSATKIAARLAELVASGETASYAKKREELLAALPDEGCLRCLETGRRGSAECPFCEGLGWRRPWETEYSFSVENVADFAAFCRESGGFKIR